MKKLITIGTLALALPVLAACNTIAGVGKDVAATGEVVTDTAENVKEELSE